MLQGFSHVERRMTDFCGESFFWHLPHYKADITPAEGDIRF
ncbi:hypothetical protein SAMN05216191_118115 [Paenibacillus jilunlii]|uniref:Uncharacterized protein n=1 Tax=Paenibacillus jilunlii TaxID=682956 RepID=A0A1G9W6F3_9BACL|nr:hypothetical protein SAMN05216191_118115 [Paenibacillus jilunlii]